MSGSRPLTDSEISQVLINLDNLRDQCLFIVGLRTGFRISELLSLRVSDFIEYGTIRDCLTVRRSNMKGKTTSRSVPLHDQAKDYLLRYLTEIAQPRRSYPENNCTYDILSLDGTKRLFPFTRQHASRVLKTAMIKAKVRGKVSTHSMRKTFADKVYTSLDENIFKLQKALGHARLDSTAHYVSFRQEDITAAILGSK